MDFDGDGQTDVISGSYPGELYLFRRESDGTFEKGEIIKDRDGEQVHAGYASTAWAVDWDGDEDLDLILGNISGDVHLSMNEGTRTKPAYVKPVKLELVGDLGVRGGDSGPIVADWDGDGLHDLLVGMGDGSVVWFRNEGTTGKPNFASGQELVAKSVFGFDLEKARPDQGQWGARVKIHVVDFNGDGRLDLLLGDRSGSTPRDASGGDQERPAADSRAAVKSKPVRHGFVWLFERRAAANVSGR